MPRFADAHRGSVRVSEVHCCGRTAALAVGATLILGLQHHILEDLLVLLIELLVSSSLESVRHWCDAGVDAGGGEGGGGKEWNKSDRPVQRHSASVRNDWPDLSFVSGFI
jgi:hypothetical protein